ncbi:MAG: RNA polymerase sigma factor [Candidatus Flemingiibacterium sp.]
MEPFETIYEQYFPRVYSFIYRMCRDEDLSEELTQETFFQAFRSFPKYRGESELFTWLASIAKYTFFSYMRKNRRSGEDVDIELLADTLLDPENDPEEKMQHKETVEAIRRAISRIPEKYRDVVVLRLYAELPFSEVADALSISENSAKVIFHRAKKLLSEELKNEHIL